MDWTGLWIAATTARDTSQKQQKSVSCLKLTPSRPEGRHSESQRRELIICVSRGNSAIETLQWPSQQHDGNAKDGGKGGKKNAWREGEEEEEANFKLSPKFLRLSDTLELVFLTSASALGEPIKNNMNDIAFPPLHTQYLFTGHLLLWIDLRTLE